MLAIAAQNGLGAGCCFGRRGVVVPGRGGAIALRESGLRPSGGLATAISREAAATRACAHLRACPRAALAVDESAIADGA